VSEKRTTVHHRRFRPRQIELDAGGKLVLKVDGSIQQLDSEGKSVGSWLPADDEWATHAIRFGLQPRPETAPPPSRREREPFIR
jgi:hypothetical protein